MCGICGLAGFEVADLLGRMTDALTHPVPDSDGFFRSPETSVGVARPAPCQSAFLVVVVGALLPAVRGLANKEYPDLSLPGGEAACPGRELARRPAHPAAAQQMQMNVKDGLAGAASGV